MCVDQKQDCQLIRNRTLSMLTEEPNFSKVHNSVFTLCFVSEGAGVGSGERWGGEGERKTEGECVRTCIRCKT